jgi:hypothetical protein
MQHGMTPRAMQALIWIIVRGSNKWLNMKLCQKILCMAVWIWFTFYSLCPSSLPLLRVCG